MTSDMFKWLHSNKTLWDLNLINKQNNINKKYCPSTTINHFHNTIQNKTFFAINFVLFTKVKELHLYCSELWQLNKYPKQSVYIPEKTYLGNHDWQSSFSSYFPSNWQYFHNLSIMIELYQTSNLTIKLAYPVFLSKLTVCYHNNLNNPFSYHQTS